MIAMTKARLDVVPLTKHSGAEIRGLDLHDRPDDETIRAIYRAWLDHLVIVFPDQKLQQEDLVRVTGYFGEMGMPRRPPRFFPKGYSRLLPGIMLISNIRENGDPIGALPDGEMMFHHDVIDHAGKKEFVYDHVWRVGDLLLWDNRCSSHGRTDFPSTQRRLMWRTTVKGAGRPY